MCLGISLLLALLFSSFNVSAKPVTEIIVATYIEPPFSDIINGEFVGENIDIAYALADIMNKKVRFAYCPAARCFSLMQNGRADMIIAVRKTVIREQFLDYLASPIKIQKQPLRFYIRAGHAEPLTTYDDLKPLRIGVLRGASYFDRFDHDTEINKIPLTNHKQLIDMLLKGRIDTFLEREESIAPLIDESFNFKGIKMAEFSYNKSVGSYIAIAKKSIFSNELGEFSEALEALQHNGEIKKIIRKTRNSL